MSLIPKVRHTRFSRVHQVMRQLSDDLERKKPLRELPAKLELLTELLKEDLPVRDLCEAFRATSIIAASGNAPVANEAQSVWSDFADRVTRPENQKEMTLLDICNVLKSLNELKAVHRARQKDLVIEMCKLITSEDRKVMVEEMPTNVIKSYLRSLAIATDRTPTLTGNATFKAATSLLSRLVSGRTDITPSNLSALIWSIASVGVRDPLVFKSLEDIILQSDQHFSALELFHIIWAFSFADQSDKQSEKLTRFLLTNMTSQLTELQPSRVCTLLRAVAIGCAQARTPEFFELSAKLMEEAFPLLNLKTLHAKDIAQLAVALTKVGQASKPKGAKRPACIDDFIPRLRDYLLDCPDDVPDSFYRSMLWCVSWYKKDNKPERRLLIATCKRLVKDEVGVDDTATMLWSMSRLRSRDLPPEVLKVVSSRVINSAGSISAASISSILFAFAKLGAWSDEMGEAIAPRIATLLPQFNSSELSSVLWAYAIGGHVVPSLLAAATREVANRPKAVDQYGPKHMLGAKDEWVCKWSITTLLDECPDALLPFDIFDRIPGLKDTQGEMAGCHMAPTNSSESHADMSQKLNQLGVPHQNEAIINGVTVDIAIPSYKIALEADGPWHFNVLPDGSKRYDGPSQWKQRRLNMIGWTVLSVQTRQYELKAGRLALLKKLLSPYIPDIDNRGE